MSLGILSQAAFLSAIVGEDIAEATARAAVATLFEEEKRESKWNHRSLCRNAKQGKFAFSLKPISCN